jgi:hypothetical protein
MAAKSSRKINIAPQSALCLAKGNQSQAPEGHSVRSKAFYPKEGAVVA